MNQDLKQFISQKQSMPGRKRESPLLESLSNTRQSQNFSTATAKLIKNRSLKSIDEVSSQYKQENELVVEGTKSVPALETGTQQHSQRNYDPQLTSLSRSSILSSKKDFMASQQFIPKINLVLNTAPSDHDQNLPDYEFKTQRFLANVQQPNLHSKQGTIAQSSNLFPYLQRIPATGREIMPSAQMLQARPQETQKWPYEVLTGVHSTFVQNQKSKNTNLAALLIEKMHSSDTQKNFFAGDMLHGELKGSPSRNAVQARLATLPSHQHLNKVTIKPPKLETRPKIDASMEKFGLATTTSFNKKQLRSINFQRGANGPTTQIVPKQKSPKIEAVTNINSAFMSLGFSQNSKKNLKQFKLRNQETFSSSPVKARVGIKSLNPNQSLHSGLMVTSQDTRSHHIQNTRQSEQFSQLLDKSFNDIYEKLTQQAVQLQISARALGVPEQAPVNISISQMPKQARSFVQKFEVTEESKDMNVQDKSLSRTSCQTLEKEVFSPINERIEEDVQPELKKRKTVVDTVGLNFRYILEEKKKIAKYKKIKTGTETFSIEKQNEDRPISQDSIQQLDTINQIPSNFLLGQQIDTFSVQSPNSASAYQTKMHLRPINLNETSNMTLGSGILDEMPRNVEMARTFVANDGQNRDKDDCDVNLVCTCNKHQTDGVDLNRTQFLFQSESFGSELKGWDEQKNKNHTLQSQIEGQSNLDDTIYNKTFMVGNNNGFTTLGAFKTTNMEQSAIRIEHSPQLKKIYSRNQQDFLHNHHKTYQRVVQARNISLDPSAVNKQPFTGRVDLQAIKTAHNSPHKTQRKDEFVQTQRSLASNSSFKGDEFNQRSKKISAVMQSQDGVIRKPFFQALTNNEQRKVVLLQKRSLMQLPNLPPQILSQSAGDYDDSDQDALQSMKMSSRGPNINLQKAHANKFVSQSSSVRQKQLIKVQKEKSHARLNLHIQRFQKLFDNKGGVKNKAQEFIESKIEPDFVLNTFQEIARFNKNITKHSPQPMQFVQSPPPSIQAQEKRMNSLIQKILQTQIQSRSMIQEARNHQRTLTEGQHFQIPTVRMTERGFSLNLGQ